MRLEGLVRDEVTDAQGREMPFALTTKVAPGSFSRSPTCGLLGHMAWRSLKPAAVGSMRRMEARLPAELGRHHL